MGNRMAIRIMTAKNWWDELSKESKEEYVQEHPNSKYAQKWAADPKNKQKLQQLKTKNPKIGTPEAEDAKGKDKKDKKKKDKKKDFDFDWGPTPKVKRKDAQDFMRRGGAKAKSKQRQGLANNIGDRAGSLVTGILKDTAKVGAGVGAAARIMTGNRKSGDGKTLMSLMGTALGVSLLTAATGGGALAGALAFGAIKHVGVPAVADLMRLTWKGFRRGVYNLSTEGKEAKDSTSKKDEDWTFASAALELRAAVDEGDPKVQKLFVQSLIGAIAEYVKSGDIPEEAWSASVEKGSQDSELKASLRVLLVAAKESSEESEQDLPGEPAETELPEQREGFEDLLVAPVPTRRSAIIPAVQPAGPTMALEDPLVPEEPEDYSEYPEGLLEESDEEDSEEPEETDEQSDVS